ncbi:uncharacterized protein LOC129308272 [Prosopis cineraria]|uniref:uncharacterized protein LOC129308272 n=1 Tax=Prosopis cineraria TaxID=364024 RepID=UPI002410A8DB|nr:uncharacterized protein LOC129308272 [Prosopis cineraria]XP_054805315.1 uncharacterized protein LOC129308272 [Prosopis cineraria]
MDLWVVAAATGAGYLAKYWKRISKNSDGTFQLSLSSEDSKVENSESLSCPFARQAWNDGLGKVFSSNIYLLDGPMAGEMASTAIRGLDNEEIRGFRTYSKSSVLSLSNLSLPISPNENYKDIENVNEQSSNIASNYGFHFSDSSAEVGSKYYSAGRKISLRTKHLLGHFIRPVSSLDSCLLAQLLKEHAKLEEYVFSSHISPSTATRSFFVSDGNQIVSGKSIDSSNALIQSEDCKLHEKDFHEKDENVFGIPSLPKIGSSEDPNKVKFKVGKGRSGRLSSSNNVFSRKHMHSQHDTMFLFSLGISFGIIAFSMTNKREFDNLRGLLRQTENLVQDLQEELEMKNSVTVKELHNENYGPLDMCDHSFYERDTSRCSPEKHIDTSPRNNYKELHDQREEESSGSMSKIEAELEAELERLGLNMNTSSLDRRLSDFVELDPEFEADFAQGELQIDMVSWKAFAHRKSNDDAGDISTPLPTTYAVSPHELSLRLHEVIQSRLEERVKELEIALENSQRKVKMTESKLNGRYQRKFPGCRQASPFTGEASSVDEEWEHPLVLNLSGEALDAYNEAYEELVKRDDSEENSPSGIYNIGPKEGSHGRRALDFQLSGVNGSVTHSSVKMSGEITSSKVTMLEGQSSGLSKLNVNVGENSGLDYEMELIRKIVERTKKGSPVFQNAQRILHSTD